MNATPEQICLVAEEHINLYVRRVAMARAGDKHYNLRECEYYLATWTSILEKGGLELSSDEQDEVEDAYESGEYEDLLGVAL